MEAKPPPQISQMPKELLEKIFEGVTLNDKLRMRATCSWFFEYWTTEKIPELAKPDVCKITTMCLAQLKNSLHIRAYIEEVNTAQHFVGIGRHCSKAWKRKDKKTSKVECFFTLPIDGPHDFALLEGASIGHFFIDKRIPFQLTTESVKWLKTLLSGCAIEKLSLDLDANSVPLLKEVPEIVSVVHAKHVEIIVQSVFNAAKYSLARNINKNVAKLVEAGVKQVTITADVVNNPRLSYEDNVSKDLNVDYAAIFALLKGGMLDVTFDAEFSDKKFEEKNSSYKKFLKKLIRLGQDVSITFKAASLPDCLDGQTFQATPNHPVYVTNVTRDLNATRRSKDELHIKLQ